MLRREKTTQDIVSSVPKKGQGCCVESPWWVLGDAGGWYLNYAVEEDGEALL